MDIDPDECTNFTEGLLRSFAYPHLFAAEDEKQSEDEKRKVYCMLFNDIFLMAVALGKEKKLLSMEYRFDLAQTWLKPDNDGTFSLLYVTLLLLLLPPPPRELTIRCAQLLALL